MSLDNYRAALLSGDATRAAAFEKFAAQGFPGKHLESWHYTDFTPLAEALFTAQPSAAETASFPHDSLHALKFSDCKADAYSTAFALDGLNAALASRGVDKTLMGEARSPWLIAHVSPGAGGMAHWRHRLSLSEGAQHTLVLWDAPDTDAGESLLTAVLRLKLEARSKLRLIRVLDAGAQANRALHIAARLDEAAELEVIQLDFGGKRVRQELHVTLCAPGAQFHLASLSLLDGRSHVDNQTTVFHAAPQTSSRSDARLIAAGKSRAILNARVQVAPRALKTDSETRIASLLLSETAEIDAKPELEINADDVKCAHGASFGQLDEDAAFYLRSRGIAAAEAQGLLTLAFAQSVLDRVPLPGLRAWAEARVQALLAGAAA